MSAWRGRRGVEDGTLLTRSLNPSGPEPNSGQIKQSDRELDCTNNRNVALCVEAC